MVLVLWLVVIVISFLLQIYVWPRIPKSIFKYRGLVLSLSLSLIILIFVVRIPLEITALTLPFYLMMFFGLFLFWKDRKL